MAIAKIVIAAKPVFKLKKPVFWLFSSSFSNFLLFLCLFFPLFSNLSNSSFKSRSSSSFFRFSSSSTKAKAWNNKKEKPSVKNFNFQIYYICSKIIFKVWFKDNVMLQALIWKNKFWWFKVWFKENWIWFRSIFDDYKSDSNQNWLFYRLIQTKIDYFIVWFK